MPRAYRDKEIEGEAITVTLNGDEREVPAGLSVAELLEWLELPDRMVAIELNEEVLKQDALDESNVSEGDKLEIVNFVGGG